MSIGAEPWLHFASRADAMDAPLYATLARAVHKDHELRALTDGRKSGQPPVNLLFGAVHFLLLRGAQHSLRDFYPTQNGGRPWSGDPFPAFRDFCLSHRSAIVTMVESRVTNTNEIGRTAMLNPGFQALRAVAPEPFNLIEIGPSAGLNLNWYRYGVRYLRDGKPVALRGSQSDLVIDAELRGEALPPDGDVPQVKKAIGIERDPVDLSNADDRDWLRALVWADHVGRYERLEKAIAIAGKHPPAIWKGDAMDLMVPALRAMPESETLCVFHTIALYQFTEEMRETLFAMLTMAGLRRPVYRLSMEELMSGMTELRLFRYHDGTVEDWLLGHCNSHGAWLEWVAK